MTIETYCDHCRATISELITLSSTTHVGIIAIGLDPSVLKCNKCDGTHISLRIIGGTVKLDSMNEE